jgi:SEL1 protein
MAATRAYKQALFTLSTLTAHLPSYTQDPSFGSYAVNPTSILSSFAQNQGPLGSAVRIIIKLQQHSWLPRFISGIGKEGLGSGPRKTEDEAHGKAIKVVDLLQHSAELGYLEALYVLAQISLVRLTH